jgi:hypothetical protein
VELSPLILLEGIEELGRQYRYRVGTYDVDKGGNIDGGRLRRVDGLNISSVSHGSVYPPGRCEND